MLNETQVVIFSSNDRTTKLADFCFTQLGFKNILILSDNTSFVAKYKLFVTQGLASQYSYFIRSDGDCLVFDDILRALDEFKTSKDIWHEGFYFDYIMNKFRGGTPHILKREVLEQVSKNRLIHDNRKPESTIFYSLSGVSSVRFFSCLHEFEQYPSKIYRSFQNRISRGDGNRLYDQEYINTLPEPYKEAIRQAKLNNNKRESMTFSDEDLSYLDKDFKPIEDKDIPELYTTYKKMYDQKLKQFKG